MAGAELGMKGQIQPPVMQSLILGKFGRVCAP